ncbi:MAG: hypothetical protein VCA36_12240, partial [Opitutales bacterium]
MNVAAILWIRGEVLDFFGKKEAVEHDGPQLRIVAVSPDEGRVADDVDRLTFVFNRAVVTEQEIGKRLSWEPFSIEPAPRPAGQWVWVKPAMLEYRLGDRLPTATRFQVTAGDDYVQWLGIPLRGQREFTFSTRALAV